MLCKWEKKLCSVFCNMIDANGQVRGIFADGTVSCSLRFWEIWRVRIASFFCSLGPYWGVLTLGSSAVRCHYADQSCRPLRWNRAPAGQPHRLTAAADAPRWSCIIKMQISFSFQQMMRSPFRFLVCLEVTSRWTLPSLTCTSVGPVAHLGDSHLILHVTIQCVSVLLSPSFSLHIVRLSSSIFNLYNCVHEIISWEKTSVATRSTSVDVHILWSN